MELPLGRAATRPPEARPVRAPDTGSGTVASSRSLTNSSRRRVDGTAMQWDELGRHGVHGAVALAGAVLSGPVVEATADVENPSRGEIAGCERGDLAPAREGEAALAAMSAGS